MLMALMRVNNSGGWEDRAMAKRLLSFDARTRGAKACHLEGRPVGIRLKQGTTAQYRVQPYGLQS